MSWTSIDFITWLILEKTFDAVKMISKNNVNVIFVLNFNHIFDYLEEK